jgi:hypothetical protein
MLLVGYMIQVPPVGYRHGLCSPEAEVLSRPTDGVDTKCISKEGAMSVRVTVSWRVAGLEEPGLSFTVDSGAVAEGNVEPLSIPPASDDALPSQSSVIFPGLSVELAV